MREIKFRAWGCHEVTYNWEIEDEYGFPLATYSKPSMIYVGLINGLDEMHHNPSKLKFMQYTGLKDKNGVEIYEGDIVKWGHIEKFQECWHRVAFVELFPCLQFHILNYIDGKTLEYKKGDNYIFGYSNFIYKNTHEAMEVIGNIYENQELLES